ncbi:hypothetical protein RB195_013887 [Necator americanus]|uniref:Mos1 transposase HTH domain-containing protein n=1 Tax=Necator americanus TaxID=51031 RepID=A0ABR1DZ70_NECAM
MITDLVMILLLEKSLLQGQRRSVAMLTGMAMVQTWVRQLDRTNHQKEIPPSMEKVKILASLTHTEQLLTSYPTTSCQALTTSHCTMSRIYRMFRGFPETVYQHMKAFFNNSGYTLPSRSRSWKEPSSRRISPYDDDSPMVVAVEQENRDLAL